MIIDLYNKCCETFTFLLAMPLRWCCCGEQRNTSGRGLCVLFFCPSSSSSSSVFPVTSLPLSIEGNTHSG